MDQYLRTTIMSPTTTKITDLRWAWVAALALFVLAGLTGSLYRFGLLYGLPADLQLANVRHAHSHLMYYGWVTPALMSLIAVHLLRGLANEQVRRLWRSRLGLVIGLTLALAVLAYVLFLLYGYGLAAVGRAQMPPAVIASFLNLIGWYAFIFLYWRLTRGQPRRPAWRLWDLALGFLLLASLGGWGLALARPLQINHPALLSGLTHFFLDLFSYGWFLLALLGLMVADVPQIAGQRLAAWAEGLLLMGLPVIFLLSMPVGLVPPAVRVVAGVAGLLVAVGLWLYLWLLWPQLGSAWRIPLLFMGLSGVALVSVSLPGVADWAAAMGLRVSYLHWLLLGFVSLGLLAAAAEAWGEAVVNGRVIFTVAALILILSLIPLTRLWPVAWGGRWTLVLAAWVSLGPILGALLMIRSNLVTVPK
jgi:hypothetical protein